MKALRKETRVEVESKGLQCLACGHGTCDMPVLDIKRMRLQAKRPAGESSGMAGLEDKQTRD